MIEKNRLALLVLIVSSCRGSPTVVSAGDLSLTVAQLQARLADTPRPDHPVTEEQFKDYLLTQIETGVLLAEAKRRNLVPTPAAQGQTASDDAKQDAETVAALKNTIADEIKSTVKDSDITDAEMLAIFNRKTLPPHYPDRAMVSAAIFKRQADAERFATVARKLPAEAGNTRFVELFHDHLKRIMAEVPVDSHGLQGAETWDFLLARQAQTLWPQSLVEPALAAKYGDIVGPIFGVSDNYKEPRFYVLHVNQVLKESNSFEQYKSRLRDMAMHERIENEALQEIRRRVLAAAVFNEDGIKQMLSWLETRSAQSAAPASRPDL